MYLVTGSTGFIGSKLCQALVAQGHSVRAFHRASSSLIGLAGLPVEHVIGDVTQPETVQRAMQGVQVVFHTAALLGAGQYPGQLREVTVLGTRTVMRAALEAGVQRVVHTSSVAALGVPPLWVDSQKNPPLMDEAHTWNYDGLKWPYGAAKYQAELEVQNVVAQGLDAVIVNPSIILGAGEVNRHVGSIIMLIAAGKIPFLLLTGGLNAVHIDDVIAGHLAAFSLGKTGERYLLGGENLTIHQFIEKACQVTGARLPRFTFPTQLAKTVPAGLKLLRSVLRLPIGDELFMLIGRYFYLNISKSQQALSLEPPRSVEQAMREAYAWFRQSDAV